MAVTLTFPLVMKMEFSMVVKNAEKLSLKDVQQKAFNLFWATFSALEKHGSIEHVQLLDGEVQIKTDEMWKTHLKTSKNFQVIFNTPHLKKS